MAAFPSSPAPTAPVLVSSITPTLRSYSQSMKRQVRSRGGQRWGVRLVWPPMLIATFAPMKAFLATLRGGFNTCTYVLPSPQDVPLGTWAGSPAVDGASQTGRAIALKGFTAGATVKAGDFLKFSDSKIYMATADGTASGAGKIASQAIEPALIVSPADGETITATSVPFQMEMVGDVFQWQANLPNHFIFAVDLVEAY
jgi:hypothetical protein